jgi:hypothetical protein
MAEQTSANEVSTCEGYGARVELNADGRGTCPVCGACVKVYAVGVARSYADSRFHRGRAFANPNGRINRHPKMPPRFEPDADSRAPV